MDNQAVSPNPRFADYDDLIDAAGGQRDFSTVCMKDGRFNTTSTFKFLSTDVEVRPKLPQNLATLDDRFTRKHAHDGVVAQLARTMVNKHYGATPVTFDAILNALTRRKEMEAALARGGGVAGHSGSELHPDGLLLPGRPGLLVELEEDSVIADARTYDALVLGVCKARKLEVASRAIRRMVEKGKPAMHAQAAEYVKTFAGSDRRLCAENLEFLAG